MTTIDAPFRYDRKLTSIAIAYTNQEYIADEAFPIVQIPGQGSAYTYRKYRIGEAYRVPDTTAGRTSDVREVEHGYDEIEASTKDYGLQEPVPRKDINNAPNGYDPLGMAAEWTMGLVKLDRERRAASRIFSASSYPAAQTQVLSGTSKFSDPASDPIATIVSAIDQMVIPPNKMIWGQQAFTAFRRHPKIVALFQARTGVSDSALGLVPQDFVQQIFGMRIAVGQAWIGGGRVNVSNLAGTQSRIWGPHLALVRHERIQLPYTRTFSFTAYSKAVGMRYDDPRIGLEGGVRVKVGEMLDEVISEPSFGYFFQDVA